MKILILLLALAGTAASANNEFTFSQVQREQLTGLRFEKSELVQKIRDDAAAYAYYRRYPKSERGAELWQNCYEERETNLFCDVILFQRERANDPGAGKEARNKFYQTLMTLDAEAARAKNCPAARKNLTAIAEDPESASLHIRATYWLWKCAQALNDQEEAARLSARMNQKYPVAHHTLLILQEEASERLNEIFAGAPDWPVRFRSEAVPEINIAIAGVEALMEQKEDGAAAVFGVFINARLPEAEPELRLYVAQLMSRVSASIPSTLPVARVLVPLFQEHPRYIAAPVLKLLFPDDYQMAGADPKKRFVFRHLIEEHKQDLDAHVLKGLIHQESALNPRAASPALAYGLSQMLIGTANDQWRKISGDANAQVTPAMLFEPDFSVKLGAADFKRRLQNFNGNRILAIASYNAGEAGVKNWLKEVKPIRDPQILADLLFMNRAPESHVPQYVSAVLGKAFWYSRLYP